MDREVLYDRQKTLQLEVPEKVVVVGAGGVGTWVALFSAMSGVEEIVIYDDDIVEPTNLNRLPFKSSMVGLPKVEAVEALIFGVRPNCKVKALKSRITKEELEHYKQQGYKIIDTTDDIETQRLTAEVDSSRIRAGYDGGFSITVTEGFPPKWVANVVEGYAVTPSWVVTAVVTAALAVLKLCKIHDLKLNIDLDRVGLLAEKVVERVVENE